MRFELTTSRLSAGRSNQSKLWAHEWKGINPYLILILRFQKRLLTHLNHHIFHVYWKYLFIPSFSQST